MNPKYSPLYPLISALSLLLFLLLPTRLCHAQACCADGNSTVSTYAGTGTAGYSGNGGAATSATLNNPYALALDAAGNLYIADCNNAVIRKVTPAGIITTYAGTGTAGYSGDGGPATSAQLGKPIFLSCDSLGNLYVADSGWGGIINANANIGNNVIRKITPGGIISTFAGTGTAGYTGDGGPATSANINLYDLAVDQYNDVIFTDPVDSVIRMVTPAGIISTIAGNGTYGYSGNGVPATTAQLASPEGVAFDPGSASLYFWDDDNEHFRKIDSCGNITTVAGNGTYNESGNGGPALSAGFGDAEGVAYCGSNLYMADFVYGTVRRIDACGNVQAVGGLSGTNSDTGNGGQFLAATLNYPEGIIFDPAGNMYVAEMRGNIVRKISKDCAPTPTPECVLVPTATPACTQPINLSPTNTPTNSPTVTPSSTPTITPTKTPSNTPTLTPSLTPSATPTLTPTITPTFTPTCEIHLWPNPYNPQYAIYHSLKISCLPTGATVYFYTLSGELVNQANEVGGVAQWKGINIQGLPVSTGIYYYVIQNGTNVLGRGKFLVSH